MDDVIAETVLTAKRTDGVTLTMVTFAGGGIGIARDGRPLAGQRWPDGQTKQCVAALVRLAGLLAGEGEADGRAGVATPRPQQPTTGPH